MKKTLLSLVAFCAAAVMLTSCSCDRDPCCPKPCCPPPRPVCKPVCCPPPAPVNYCPPAPCCPPQNCAY